MGQPTRSLTSKPGAGGDDPLLNGPTEGWLHSSGRPGCRTPLVHLLQPLHVQRGVHSCWSHGCRLPTLSGFLLLNSNSTHDLPGGKAVRSCAGHRSLRRPYRNMIRQSIQAVRDAHNNIFQTVPEGISDSSGEEQTSNKCYNMIFFRRSSSTKGLYGQEIKEKYIFDNSKSKRG